MAKKKKKLSLQAVVKANKNVPVDLNLRARPKAPPVPPEILAAERRLLAEALQARTEYHGPVEALFSFGEPDFNEKWPDYGELGLSEDDVPELVRLACDVRIDFAQSWLVGSAPIHAMRILALRKNSEFLPPLFATFPDRDDHDLFREQVPLLIAAIGEAAIAPVKDELKSPERSVYDRANLGDGLVALARSDRALRSRIVSVLASELERYAHSDPVWNAFLIINLTELAAGETLPLIERAFAAGAVDESIGGDLGDVRATLGLEKPLRDFSPHFLRDSHAIKPKPTFSVKPPKP